MWVAALGSLRIKFLATRIPLTDPLLPVAVLAVGVLLGWRFNRSRVVFALLLLALADRLLRHYGGSSSISSGPGQVVYQSIALFLPLNLALIALMEERGLFNWRGITRILLILVQPLLLAGIVHHRPALLLDIYHFSFSNQPLLLRLPLPQPATVTIVLSFTILFGRWWWRRGAMESGFFWVLPISITALTMVQPGPETTFFFAIAGLTLTIAVIESSHFMAYRDELTKLPARRALNEHLLQLGSRYALAMVDIDFFKKFNDRYGHDVGDQVLRMVATRLSRTGGGGKAFRYGGEEFTILFPGRTADEAMPFLEQLRQEIADTGFSVRNRPRPRKKPPKPRQREKAVKKVSLTVSIGIGEPDDRHPTPGQALKRADQALYRAKKAGRNRIIK